MRGAGGDEDRHEDEAGEERSHDRVDPLVRVLVGTDAAVGDRGGITVSFTTSAQSGFARIIARGYVRKTNEKARKTRSAHL